MGRGGGLVFTGMPRRREVLGTGIIRWEKVVNPDGTVTWQEAQPTPSPNSKKEEKCTKVEKPKLERPSWIESKKESTHVRVNNMKRPANEVEDLAQKEPKVEARLRRAFSFQTEEEKTERTGKTTNVEEVRFGAPIRDDDKKGFVAGLATKFGSTRKAEDMQTPKKDIVEIQPAHAVHLPTEEKNNTKLPAHPLSAQTKKETGTDPIDSRSHWSIRDDNKQESDAELAQRLANTEKIFRQQEQKIQAALDKIRDLERQLASGFANNNTESDEFQNNKTSDNESIAAGGRESGPHFRHISSKGPLPCFSDEPHYRVLTVNSNKAQLCAVNHVNHHEGSSSTCCVQVVNDNSRTPSPIAVNIHIPAPARRNPEPPNPPKTHHHHHQPPLANTLKLPKPSAISTINAPPPSHNLKANSNNTPAAATKHKHKPLPLLPTDACAIRPTPSMPPPTTTTTPSLCVRPRPLPRSVSSFKKQQRIRPLTPIPEEPCSLKRRPRVGMRRSWSSVRRVSGVSVSRECGVRPGSGSGSRAGSVNKSYCEGREGGGWKGEGFGGGLRTSFERCKTN